MSSTHNYGTSHIIRRILGFVLPFRLLVVGTLIFGLLFSLFSAFTLAIVEPVFRTLFSDGGSAASTTVFTPVNSLSDQIKGTFDSLINRHVLAGSFRESIFNLSVVICLLFMGRAAAKYFGNLISTRLEEGVMKAIRDTVFSHVSNMSMDFFGRRKSGEIISLLTNDVAVINSTTVNSIIQLWREGTTVLVFILALLVISSKLTLIAFGITLLGVVIIRFSTQFLRRYGARIQSAQAAYTSTLQETILGIRVVKSLAIEASVVERFTSQTAHLVRSIVKNVRVLSLVPAVNDVFGIIALVAVFYAGAAALDNQEIAPSSLMTFLFLLFGLMQPISTIISVVAGMQRGIVAASNIIAVLDEVPTVPEHGTMVPTFADHLMFENVSFSYGDKTVLSNVSFSLHRGKTIAFVGESGSGKSTLLDLVMRFYDPLSGRIGMDGMDIRSFDIRAYRRLFGVVSQENILFNDTILANITVGDPSPDTAKAMSAARAAHAHDFVMELPSDYQTVIGDRGMKLSGGQRQRIAIARALYRDPRVLLFDEATSALDTKSERIVQEAINDLLRGRSAIIVAHRLSTIVAADVIFVVHNGAIIEHGTHQELLDSNGEYTRLYHSQFLR